MPFSDVQYQPVAHERIQQALASGRVPHAYLFAGRPGVGREMMAARLGQLLLCQSPIEISPLEGSSRLAKWRDACGKCDDCRLFTSSGHPDYHRIYRTLNQHHPDKLIQKRKAMDLSVEVIRHFLLDCVGLSPSRQCAKVFVVAEAERLSPSAQNAMLKTLEEPPGHSYLILIASSADELLPTTQSRCHLVQFNGLPGDFVQRAIVERTGIELGAARFLTEMSSGSLGLALEYARRELFGNVPGLIESLELARDEPLAASKLWQDLAKAIAEKAGEKKKAEPQEDFDEEEESAEADETLNAAPKGPETRTLREAQLTLLAMLSTVLRDIQRIAVGYSPAALPNDRKLSGVARAAAPREIGKAIRAIWTAEDQLELNANGSLIFDSLAIAIGNALADAAALSPR